MKPKEQKRAEAELRSKRRQLLLEEKFHVNNKGVLTSSLDNTHTSVPTQAPVTFSKFNFRIGGNGDEKW